MASNLSTSAYFFDIRTPVVAYHGPSKAPKLIFTSGFLYRRRYIAVAQIWSCGEKMLGKSWQSAAAALELATWQFAMNMSWKGAMDDLIGWIGMQDRYRIR